MVCTAHRLEEKLNDVFRSYARISIYLLLILFLLYFNALFSGDFCVPQKLSIFDENVRKKRKGFAQLAGSYLQITCMNFL